MTPHGRGNGGHPLALIGEQDCQTAFCKVCGADTTCAFSRASRCSGISSIGLISALCKGGWVSVSIRLKSLILSILCHSYNPFRAGAYYKLIII